MDSWNLIKQLAKARGVAPVAVEKWRARGVPHKYRLPFIQDAAAMGEVLGLDDFGPRVSPRTGEAA